MVAATGPAPLRTLAALSIGVLLAHGLVVHQAALGLNRDETITPRVFVTRTVAAPPPAPEPAAPAAVPVPPRPAPVRRTMAVEPATPVAAPAPAPVAVAQAPAAPAVEVPTRAAPAPETPASAPLAASEPAAQPVPAPPPAAAAATVAAPAPPIAPRAGTEAPRNFAVPGSMRLKFNVLGNKGTMEYRASGELTWLHDGSHYQARMEVGAFMLGSRVWSSTGQIGAGGVEPVRFSDKSRSEQAAHFDRERARITFSANTPEAVLLPGAQDQLSVFMQLAALLAGEPARYPAGSSITVQTASARLAEPWVFVVESPERLHLPGGEQATLKLTRQPRREFDQKVELWLAPALAYLPARIRTTDRNGDSIDQQWRSTASP